MMNELPWGIYNKYACAWWMQTNEPKPMVFPTEQAARNFIARAEKEEQTVYDADEAYVTQSINHRKWQVLTYSICEGWHNCWNIEINGVSQLQTFASLDEAQAELDEHIRDSIEACANGDLEEPYSYDDYAILEMVD